MTTFRGLGDPSAEGIRVASQDDLDAAVAACEQSVADAQAAASAAEASAQDADATLKEFETIYLGAKASDPAVDNEGNPLITGALYFNTTDNDFNVYNGTTWQTLGIVGPASAVDENIAVFDGTTGNVIKDGGSKITDLGDVKGPASATDGNLAVFDGTTGKLIKDGGPVPGGGGGGGAPAQNLARNPNFGIAQRGAETTGLNSNLTWVDGYEWYQTTGMDTVVTVRQVENVGQPDALAGSRYFHEVLVTTPETALAAGEYAGIAQHLEINDVAHLQWGASGAETITISFWVRSSLSGTHTIAVQDGFRARAYVVEYTVNTADTWEKKTITIPGDTDAAWLSTPNNTNVPGFSLSWMLATGSTFQTTAGSWQNGNFMGTSSGVNLLASGGNSFRLGRIKIEVGSTATDFVEPNAGAEYIRALRYFDFTASLFDTPPGLYDWTEGALGVHANDVGEATITREFRTAMLYPPDITTYSTDGTVNRVDHGGTNVTPSIDNASTASVGINAGGTANNKVRCHVEADANMRTGN